MRPIEFRVWDIANKAMDYRKPQHSSLTNSFNYRSENPLMQYTGLLDKNGTKIFEGDIVKLQDFSAYEEVYYKGTIDYIQSHFSFKYLNIKPSKRLGLGTFYPDGEQNIAVELEVVGNIYEDSHLFDNN